MKTYRSVFKEGFRTVGLNPRDEARNSGLLTSCKNAYPSKEGLVGYLPTITDIFSTGFDFVDSVTHAPVTITKRWPFPQLFLTDVGIHIGALEGLFFLDPTTPLQELYSYGTGAVTWPWTCCNIAQKPAFTSGNVLVYFNDISNAYTVVTYV
jgi:hypothetical protein